MAHTKGPYTRVEQKIGDEVHICIRQEIAFGVFIAWMSKNTGHDEDNANLFVAAPELLEACEALIADETSSYCEWCDRHAPKDDEGYLIGPIPHIEGCAVGMARAAIAKAKGEVSNA